jgi:hypothetical protein
MVRTKFQAALLLRESPVDALEVLTEISNRLQTYQTFPPGLIIAIGECIRDVLLEVNDVKAQKVADAKRAADLRTLTGESK